MDGSKTYNEHYFQPDYFKCDEKTFQTGSSNIYVKIGGVSQVNLRMIEFISQRINTTGSIQVLAMNSYNSKKNYQLVKFYDEKYAHGPKVYEYDANFIVVVDNIAYARIASYSSARIRLYSNDNLKIDGTQSSTEPSGTKQVDGYSATPIIS